MEMEFNKCHPHTVLLCGGSDGGDGTANNGGVTDAAGAVVDANTAVNARTLGLAADKYLHNYNSYGFFQQYDARMKELHSSPSLHLKVGNTGTNVGDLWILLSDS